MNDYEVLKTKMVETIIQSIGGYKLTPLIIEMIKFLLKGVYEGLILVDKDGKIQFMDKYTERFFGIQPSEGLNFNITDLDPEAVLHIVAKTGIPAIGRIKETVGEKRIVSRYPIKKDGLIIGAIGKVIFHKLEEIENLHKEISQLKSKVHHVSRGLEDLNSAKYTFKDIIGSDERFFKTKELAMRVAQTDANILIIGESGTGKELLAHSIHNASPRKNRPFIRINCPAIPFELAESEFFGYEKGAFSGAKNEGKPGKFELSEGGTIFLDEIASLPIAIQSKLLRVLQEKEIERIGGKSSIKVDFRIVSATNASLSDLLAEGRFRQDLFYRLSSVPIEVPSLRERKVDIPLYINYFLGKINKQLQAKVTGISDETLKIMVDYRWPGNVRELINVLGQSILNVTEGHVILKEHLPHFLFAKSYHYTEMGSKLRNILEETESQVIKRTLISTKGNKKKAATLLGIQRSVLYQKLEKYQINFKTESF